MLDPSLKTPLAVCRFLSFKLYLSAIKGLIHNHNHLFNIINFLARLSCRGDPCRPPSTPRSFSKKSNCFGGLHTKFFYFYFVVQISRNGVNSHHARLAHLHSHCISRPYAEYRGSSPNEVRFQPFKSAMDESATTQVLQQ